MTTENETGAPAPTQNWEGAEEWMPLAWELCANECGEEACTELIWEGGPIPEPWGDRWMKYEDQAKEMIAMVRASLAAVQAPAVEEPMEMALCESVSLVLREGQAYRFHRVGDCERCMRMSAASRDAYGTVGIDMPAHVGALAVAPASEDPPAGPLDYMVPRVAKALKEAIKGRGLTQAELARRLECTEAEVSDRLSGRRNLTLSTMSEMCDLTGLRMDVRFYEPSKPPVQGSQP